MTTEKRNNSEKPIVNSALLVYLVYFTCFIFVTGLCLWLLSFPIKANNIPKPVQEEFTINPRRVYIPPYKDFEELKEIYNQISNSFADSDNLDVEIRRLYDEIKAAKVSSIANQHNNFLRDYSNEYENELSELQEYISSYEEKYTAYLDAINNIPRFLPIYYEKYNELTESLGNTYELVFEKKQERIAKNEELFELSLEAQLIADTLFDEEYDLICRLVQVESGNCSAYEQYCTAAVPEYRIMHPKFEEDNLFDVIHAPNQYSTVASGKFDRAIPSDEVKKNVEDFLRGRVELDMPLNVVFQARFEQGDGIWWYSPSGQYFCYKNFD